MPPHTTSVMAGRGSSLPAIILTLAASSFVMAFFLLAQSPGSG